MTGHERGIDMTELGNTERLLAEAARYSAHNYEPLPEPSAICLISPQILGREMS